MTRSSGHDAERKASPSDSIFQPDAMEEGRLAALRRYNILDTEREEALDRLTGLAADLLGVEVAFVAFLDTDRQWLQSSVGLDQKGADLAGALCTRTVEEESLLEIEDADEEKPDGEEQAKQSPSAGEAGLRFYAGVPILSPGGLPIGTFSIMDPKPKVLSEEERERLRDLAEMVMEELERRREACRSEQVTRRFEAVLEDPNMLAGVLTPGGRLLEVNETALGYIEESEEEVTGELFWESPWWPEEMSSQIKKNVARAAEGEYVEYEADLTDAQGRPYNVEGTIRPVRGKGQETEALVVSARDVTDREERERRLDAVFNHTYQFTGLIEPDGTLIEANDTALQFGGLDEKDVIGRPLWDTFWFAGEESRQENVKSAVARAREGEFVRYEVEVRGAEEDRIIDFSLRPITDEVGNVTMIVPEGRDITERKRRERVVRRRRQVAESIYDATGRLLRAESWGAVSDRIFEVLENVFDYPFVHVGLAEDGVIAPQKTAAEGLSRGPKAEPRLTDDDLVVTRALRAGETVVVDDIEILDNDIDYGSLSSLAGIPIGKRGAVVVGTEQTEELDRFDLHLIEVMARYAALVLERLDREEQLVGAKEEAEKANRLKTNMLANMSHEIRTPLTSILGFAEMIGETAERARETGKMDLSTVAEFSSLIERSGQRLMETLTGVLNLSKLQAGEMNLDLGPVDLAAEVSEATEEFGPQAKKAGIDLKTEIGNGPVWARADEGALRIALHNLISNAIKYTEEGGQVCLRAREDEDGVVLEIEDTGLGMDPDRVPELFEPFRQASEGKDREYEGTGLGLAVTKRAVEEMDGTIDVDTEEGEGTLFVIRLPKATVERAEKL